MIITVATQNPNKLKELQHLAETLAYALELAQVPDAPDVAETGLTFFENALLKAQSIPPVEENGWVLGEDSGLELDALKGFNGQDIFPGIYSNRWLTPALQQKLLGCTLNSTPDAEALNRGILSLMADKPERFGYYICDMVLYRPSDRMVIQARGTTRIQLIENGTAPRGTEGFGYDPIMLATEADPARTMAELSPDEKNRISHRSRAFLELIAKII